MSQSQRTPQSGGLPRLLLGLAVLLLSTLALLGAACDDDNGDDDGGGANGSEPTATRETVADDDAAIEATLQAIGDAWNGSDAEGYVGGFSDAGLLDDMGATREEALAFLPDFMGDPLLTIGTVTSAVSGGTATAEAREMAFGNILQPTRFSLVKQDGAWLIDSQEPLTPEVSEGTSVIDLKLVEFSFEYDAEAITDGNIAFATENIGGAEHEFGLLALDEGVDLNAALEDFATGIPEGIEVLGQIGPFARGESTNIVFSEPLPPGNYGLVCFVESADGTPHAFQGMTSQFTIQ